MPSAGTNKAGHTWDYIVVGTGMGGATLGYGLAFAGARVLFLERGRNHFDSGALRDGFPEHAAGAGTPQELACAGRYPDPIADTSERLRHFTPFIGTGTGGSTALYGMALERFFPEDFSPDRALGDSTLPRDWPVDYSDMAPWYAAAERLYRVRGGDDPLRGQPAPDYPPPPELSPANAELFDFFAARGLHPYALPMACAFSDACRTCQGYLCASDCKLDAASVALRDAISQHGAELLSECEVTRIEADNTGVTGLVCAKGGETVNLTARRYILAAGALETPRLLLSSGNTHWPAGLGNTRGLVGRALMRHYVDLYAVFTRARPDGNALVKQLAFNDLYNKDGEKLGSVQSFGLLPPADLLVRDMQRDIRDRHGALAGALFGAVAPILRAGLGWVLRRTVLLATTLEDRPSADNRVELAPDDEHGARLAFRYAIGPSEAGRIARMREAMAGILKPYRFLLLKQAENNERLAHVCGTCRFGTDPQTSVCDEQQRVRGLSNLYVADASVFPSSGGINPSLTIAALALRLADKLGATPND